MFLAGLITVPPFAAAEAELEWQKILKPWRGDFNAMVKRRYIRALVVHNPMLYFLDGATQRGASYELLKQFEDHINKKLKRSKEIDKIHVIFVPVPRDKLIPWLAEGRGDIAAANLTITDARRKQVDFSRPLVDGVNELVVTGPAAPALKSLDDLSSQTVYVRRSSSYYESLQALNARLKKSGKAPVKLVYADEHFEDVDLLEMVNAGLIPTVVVDSHKATFWKEIFPKITVHEKLVLREGGKIGWAFRRNSPQFSKVIDEFVARNSKGTLMGNMIIKRYLKENKWVKNSLADSERKKFESMVELFRKYGSKYDIQYLELTAQGYQESQLDHSRRSPSGAIGVMQMLPATAADPNVGIKDITKLENNIHAGAKYVAFLRKRYFDDPKITRANQVLFSLAAYNAGPARVARLRDEAERRGLNPNVWFNNVEVIAAQRIGRETVQYVANIYKYYIAYRLTVEQSEALEKARKAATKKAQ